MQKSPSLLLDVSSQTDFKFLPVQAYFGHETSIIEPFSSTMMQASILEVDEPRPKRQRNLALRRTRDRVSQKTKAPAFTMPQLDDSDAENKFAEHLTNLTAAMERESLEQDQDEEAIEVAIIRRKGHSHAIGDGKKPAVTRKLRANSTAVRRLAPLVETSQFLQTGDDSFSLAQDVSRKLDELAKDAEKEEAGMPAASCPRRVLRQRKPK